MKKLRTAIVVHPLLLAVACLTAASARAADLSVDCSKVVGEIRPLNGVNSGPIGAGGLVDLSEYHRQAGFPLTRLHDCHWPNPDVVDIHVVFPDFRADPERAESYDFARTDEYVRAVLDAGSKVVYRLGESIEHTSTKLHVNPPPDPTKWAAICVGIIRHYNQGWAGGFRHDIRYWEIWNEPENRPAMWTGDDEDYFRLYEVTAKAIKAHFPELKVGGPALGDTGRIVDGRFQPSPFLLKFLGRCRERSLPLDFFSWHLYTDDPAECMIRSRGIRAVLDEHGFTRTESHLNEWNDLPGNDWTPMLRQGQGVARERFYEQINGLPGAAFSACVLVNLQDCPVDAANYYSADDQGFGLFSPNGVPHKAFYTFKAFRLLRDTPRRLRVTGGEAGSLVVCAGTDAGDSVVQVLVANYRSPEKRVRLVLAGFPGRGPVLSQTFTLDATHDLAEARENHPPATEVAIEEDLPAPTVKLLRFRRSEP